MDTQRWHPLSARCYKPGNLSATTRPAVNWARFMEPAGDYLQLSAHRCLCTILKIYLNNYVFPMLRIRLNNGVPSAPDRTRPTSQWHMEPWDGTKQAYIQSYRDTLNSPWNYPVKLIYSHWLHFARHFLVDIFAFVALQSWSVTHRPVGLDQRSIVSFQSGSS